MPQIFSRSANTLAKLSLAVGLLAAGGAISLLIIFGRSSDVTRANEFIEQPLQFSHAHHVGDDGIDCRYCHTTRASVDGGVITVLLMDGSILMMRRCDVRVLAPGRA